MIDETVLNEKLAKWCWPDATLIISDLRIIAQWRNKQDRLEEIQCKPFTESLDAQAKYLWPKLKDLGIMSIQILMDLGQLDNCLVSVNQESFISADTPALACALAIEKLIDAAVPHD